jgi:predicted phosphoadenosine phosphosulfate sulfurtransferase
MFDLCAAEARRTGRTFGVLFVDLEAQYAATINHVEEMFARHADVARPYWVALPLSLRNAVSAYQPQWLCWDPDQRDLWVRQPPKGAITDPKQFPFFEIGMEFEDFICDFAHWHSNGELTACLVGIRCDESLNRFRVLMGRATRFEGHRWTVWKRGSVFNVYPIYDWRADDIWTYFARSGAPYNDIYNLMHRAGLSIHQMRICQPYGDDQRKGLWLFHILEPRTWPAVIARVAGANSGALYARDSGNILGNIRIKRPPGHSWESFAKLLLASMPEKTRLHFENKFAVFIQWYRLRGYPHGIPDEADPKEEAARRVPSWRRLCKALLKNDWWCKSLGFGQHASGSYERYLKIMKKRRAEWGL